MHVKETTNSISRQRGFFTIGVGIAMLAIYGVVGSGILIAHDSTAVDNDTLAAQSQVELSSNDNSDRDSLQIK